VNATDSCTQNYAVARAESRLRFGRPIGGSPHGCQPTALCAGRSGMSELDPHFNGLTTQYVFGFARFERGGVAKLLFIKGLSRKLTKSCDFLSFAGNFLISIFRVFINSVDHRRKRAHCRCRIRAVFVSGVVLVTTLLSRNLVFANGTRSYPVNGTFVSGNELPPDDMRPGATSGGPFNRDTQF